MRTVPLALNDSIALFDAIAAAKHKSRRALMNAAKPEVLAAYGNYHHVAPDLGGMEAADLTEPQKKALRHAYEVETAPLAKLRSDILSRTVAARCPFCGISESSTLDHYLPKELYPEFSVYSPNLVPCCGLCNNRKRDKVVDQNTDVRLFFHPHFDHIPELDFLKVRAAFSHGTFTLAFRVKRPAGMQQSTFEHLRSHFDQLGLADRYRKMSLEHLGSQYLSLKRTYGHDENAHRVAEQLHTSAADFAALYGNNFWKAALYSALATDHNFCDGGFEVIKPQRA